PGTIVPGGTTPLPGGSPIITPGVTVPPSGGSFQTNPGVPVGPPGGSFGSGSGYAPATDPYQSSTTAPPKTNGTTSPMQSSPTHSVFGSGYRGTKSDDMTIRAPELGPALPPNVQTIPDLDKPPMPKAGSKAPQLIEPRDKTAKFADARWAVVPAVWPK